MSYSSVIDKLTKFKLVDKYETFYEILPSVRYATEEQKYAVNNLLNICCRDIISLFNNNPKPTKTAVKKIIFRCMDELTLAALDSENREFGYQLGWFLAEKAGVDLRKGSAKKAWGYWLIEASSHVRSVGMPRRRRIDTGQGGPEDSSSFPIKI